MRMASLTRTKNNVILVLTITFFLSLHFENHLVSSDNPSGFVQISGNQFVLDSNSFLFNGFNSYWMMNIAAQQSERYKVTSVFHDASTAGLTVCRTMAFTDGGNQALQITPGVYDEQFFQGLDFVVSEARNYGMRLILSLINNYENFGGRPQYVQWAKDAGASIGSVDDFYTNDVTRAYYKDNVMNVLNRVNTFTGIPYKDDPTIMAWELINEPRCQQDLTGKTLNVWVQEMASYVKSIDNKHLLEIGMEGLYGDSTPDKKQYNPNGYQVGTDYITSNQIQEIDFATFHAYPDFWLSGKSDQEQMMFMGKWMSIHSADTTTTLKKPLVLTEFGKSSTDPGFSIGERDMYMKDVYSNIYDGAKRGEISGGLVWEILAEGLDSYGSGYDIVLSRSPSTVQIITQQSRLMASLEHSI